MAAALETRRGNSVASPEPPAGVQVKAKNEAKEQSTRTVDEAIESVTAVINKLKTTNFPGVENLLENGSLRAAKEAGVYLTSALEALKKVKRRLDSSGFVTVTVIGDPPSQEPKDE